MLKCTVSILLYIALLAVTSNVASDQTERPATTKLNESATTDGPDKITTITAALASTETTTTVNIPSATSGAGTTATTITSNSPSTGASVPGSTDTTEPKKNVPPQSKSGFDAGSFVGGIVVCAAVVAVTYFGCKAFRSKKPDYSTL